jgi:hypothetical protein
MAAADNLTVAFAKALALRLSMSGAALLLSSCHLQRSMCVHLLREIVFSNSSLLKDLSLWPLSLASASGHSASAFSHAHHSGAHRRARCSCLTRHLNRLFLAVILFAKTFSKRRRIKVLLGGNRTML